MKRVAFVNTYNWKTGFQTPVNYKKIELLFAKRCFSTEHAFDEREMNEFGILCRLVVT